MPAQIRALMSAVEVPATSRRRWVCASCGLDARPGYAACEPCEREALAKRRGALADEARASIPDRPRSCAFGSREIRESVAKGDAEVYKRAVGVAYQWAKDPQGTLLLLGPAGAGKTSLMAAVLLHVIDAGSSWSSTTGEAFMARGAWWTSAFELGNARRTTALGHESPSILKAMRATVLGIDELGAEKDGLGTEAVYEVLYERHAAGRPTIYTTPLDRPALAAKYGGGGERRLFERATVIQL